MEIHVIGKSNIAGLLIVTIGLVTSADASTVSLRLKQTCTPAFADAQKKAAAAGLLCDIWTDPDCRALAIQKGILSSACALRDIQAPFRRQE
jgi:hypothetical protein